MSHFYDALEVHVIDRFIRESIRKRMILQNVVLIFWIGNDRTSGLSIKHIVGVTQGNRREIRRCMSTAKQVQFQVMAQKRAKRIVGMK